MFRVRFSSPHWNGTTALLWTSAARWRRIEKCPCRSDSPWPARDSLSVYSNIICHDRPIWKDKVWLIVMVFDSWELQFVVSGLRNPLIWANFISPAAEFQPPGGGRTQTLQKRCACVGRHVRVGPDLWVCALLLITGHAQIPVQTHKHAHTRRRITMKQCFVALVLEPCYLFSLFSLCLIQSEPVFEIKKFCCFSLDRRLTSLTSDPGTWGAESSGK